MEEVMEIIEILQEAQLKEASDIHLAPGTQVTFRIDGKLVRMSDEIVPPYAIEKMLESMLSKEEQAELEHIRWCRYLLLNYYRYGVPENGENRDDVKRIHKDLVKYSDLEPSERDKDKEAIRITRNLQM